MERGNVAERMGYPRYRWFVLFLVWALFGLCNFNNMMIAVRAHDLIPGLGLTTQQFYLVNTATAIAPIALCLVGGMLGDRFGIRWVVGIGSVLAAAAALLRLVSSGFWPFLVCQILLGAGTGFTTPNAPKIAGVWFPPNQVSIAIGLFMTGQGLGLALGFAIGPLFPTWQSAVLIMGVLLAVASVAWLVFAYDRPKGFAERGIEVAGVSFGEGLSRVWKAKNRWWLGVCVFLVMAVTMSYVYGMPLLLEETKGVSPEVSGLIVFLGVMGYVFGTVIWPILCEKVGVVKPFFVVCTVLAGLCGLATYAAAPGIGMWLLAFSPGFFMGAGYPMMYQLPVRLREFGPRYAATPTGLMDAMGNLGVVLMLPFMFTPIWLAAGPTMAMVFLLVAIAAGGLFYLLLPETGRKARFRWQEGAAGLQRPEGSTDDL